jgi:exosortase/archaeosortase family protein
MSDRRAVIGFLLRMLIGWAIAAALLSLAPAIDRWAVSATVTSVAWTLHRLAIPHGVEGNSIVTGATALRIIPECTPVMPILLLGIAVAAYPSRPLPKLAAVTAGAAALWIYNVLRMLALMATLVWWPHGFKFVHVYLWQTMTLLVVCALFMLWLRVESATGSRDIRA